MAQTIHFTNLAFMIFARITYTNHSKTLYFNDATFK